MQQKTVGTLEDADRLRFDGAGNGIRTREYQLGKLGPYRLAMPAQGKAYHTFAQVNPYRRNNRILHP